MLSLRDFQFFDPAGDVTITADDLPHWQQPGATYFITYRTIDSISVAARNRIIAQRDDWLLRQKIDPTRTDWHKQLATLPQQSRDTFRRTVAIAFEDALDKLAGECVLKRSKLNELVAENLRHFDGDRYQLGGFVVMPNHVHVLVRMFPETDMLKQCFRWKHYQANSVNKQLKRTGHFFQAESFDHLVRDEAHFMKFRRYIEKNPSKAKLREGEFALYMPEMAES